jgi:3-hydroxyacyl-[acyl-carrier-protein] dehydratase
MRLVEEIVDVQPGKTARSRRTSRPGDWYFDGHFPGRPVIPAVVLIELLAQTAGLAIGSGTRPPSDLRVAAIGRFKFPSVAGVGARLEATATVVGRVGALIKVEGTVTANSVIVAAGDITLADLSPAGS